MLGACELSCNKRDTEQIESKAGIDIHALATVTECSYQMARKYALGDVLPELHTVIKIAEWLQTSPSWLLFGDDHFSKLTSKPTDNIIEIDQNLLRYILNKCSVFLSLSSGKEEALDFIIETIYDASHLNADTKTIHKIIDMMVSSAALVTKNNVRQAAYE